MIEVIVAIIGLGVGDYADPLELNDKDNEKKAIVQQLCDTTTTTDHNGLVSKVETCNTFKTIK